MPLYEYECDACGHRFEKIQKFSDPLEHTCPMCSGHVRKLASSPAIQFKGSGFYITDYPKGDKGSAPKSDGGRSDAEKADVPDASGKTAKSDKADTSVKTDKSSSSGDSASSSASMPSSTTGSSTPSAPGTSTKD